VDAVLGSNILTRERFLSAWVVLFGLPGLYLLGLLRLEGVRSDEKVGVTRMLVGAVFLVFAISLAPGMFGGRLGRSTPMYRWLRRPDLRQWAARQWSG